MATILKNTAKIALAGGAVFATLNKGIWESGTDKANEFLNDLKVRVLPDTYVYFQKIPSANSVNKAALHKWNNGVQNTFTFVANVPEKSCQLISKAKSSLLDLQK